MRESPAAAGTLPPPPLRFPAHGDLVPADLMPFTMLLGGARSGKSRTAARLAAASGRPVVFVATATAGDDEMAARIADHRRARPPDWSTVEEPVEIAAAVEAAGRSAYVVLDCLTLWLANVMGEGWQDDDILSYLSRLAGVLADRPGDAAVVSNEVGWGIVPADAFVRRYRDLLGAGNSRCVERAERAWLMVAGRALPLQEVPGG